MADTTGTAREEAERLVATVLAMASRSGLGGALRDWDRRQHEQRSQHHGQDQRRRQAVRLAPVAERLLAVAARLLPAGDRVRYAGEFGSELWEIAHAGGRRRAQLAYAARQVRSTWRLGRELQAPERHRAAP